jgi:PHD/YefM family antitoxin component YafN of YafNO toxin-antitoxin module
MGATWKLQVAKAPFSKVVGDALRHGPQYVTRCGEKAVVVLSTQAYEELTTNLPSFKEDLLSVPKFG